MKLIATLLQIVRRDLWLIDNDNVHGPYLWLINTLKALILSIRFFVADRMMEKASALTYYTLLAIVPSLAMLLGLARGFGLQDSITATLYAAFPGQHQVVDWCFGFADRYLEHSQKGIIMGVGVGLLLWVIIGLISNIESVFNQIWQLSHGRAWRLKFTDYLSFIIIVPLLLALTSGSQFYLQTIVGSAGFTPTTSRTLLAMLRWLPPLLMPLVFTAVYKFVPNTKVLVSRAFLAGLVGGGGFLIFQQLYISGQIWVSKYDAIYGSFAALPLLLLFVQMSWVITLYGAELCFASQNVQNFDYEYDTQRISPAYFRFLCVAVASLIYVRERLDKDRTSPATCGHYPRLSTRELGQMLRLPSKLLSKVMQELASLHVVAEQPLLQRPDHTVWIPDQPIGTYTIADLVHDLDEQGTHQFKFRYEEIFPGEWDVLQQMSRNAAEAGTSHLLSQSTIDLSRLQDPRSDLWSLSASFDSLKSWFAALYHDERH